MPVTYTSDWYGPFDGRELSPSTIVEHGYRLFSWRIDSPNPWWSRPLKLGEVGCSLSHLRCWQHGVDHVHEYLVVLDDACLERDFLARIEEGITSAGRNWDLPYLGRLPQEPDRGRVSSFAVPGYSHCTYGYMLTQRAARLLLTAGLADALIPVDEFLPAMAAEPGLRKPIGQPQVHPALVHVGVDPVDLDHHAERTVRLGPMQRLF